MIEIINHVNDIRAQRRRRDSPIGILQKRFASGHFANKEYKEKGNILWINKLFEVLVVTGFQIDLVHWQRIEKKIFVTR